MRFHIISKLMVENFSLKWEVEVNVTQQEMNHSYSMHKCNLFVCIGNYRYIHLWDKWIETTAKWDFTFLTHNVRSKKDAAPSELKYCKEKFILISSTFQQLRFFSFRGWFTKGLCAHKHKLDGDWCWEIHKHEGTGYYGNVLTMFGSTYTCEFNSTHYNSVYL